MISFCPSPRSVDTTNNRAVVNDGTTSGGWPAAKLAEVITNTRTAVSDAAYAVLTTDRMVAYTALTAARVVTLPAASAYPTGTPLMIVDETGNCSSSKTVTVSPNGSDTIDGATSASLNAPYGYIAIESNASGKWTIVDQGPQVLGLNGLTGAVTLAATDGAVIAASGATVSIGGPGGTVNKFRNGTMDVWQRGTSMTVTTAGAYTADGWIVLPTGASVAASQAGGRLTTKNSLKVTGAASVTDVIVKQRIESNIAAAFCSQTVTVQAQVYNNSGGAITPKLTVKHAGSQDVWTSPTTDVSAVSLQSCANGAWTQVAYAFSASASSYNGLEISFDFGANFGLSSQDIQITECDIRVTPGVATGLNSAPPPPELRPLFAELGFCQRYYYRRASAGIYDVIGMVTTFSSNSAYGKLFDLPAELRATNGAIGISSFSDLMIASANAASTYTVTAADNIGVPLSTRSAALLDKITVSGSPGWTDGLCLFLMFSDGTGWIDVSVEL